MTSKRPVLAETAPSQVREEEPTFARVVGMAGWCAILVGTVIVLANIYSSTDRLVPVGIGWLVLMLGMFGAFAHAAVESDRMLRYCIGAAAVLAIVTGLALAGFRYSKWPVGLIPFVPGLMLLFLFARRETDAPWATLSRYGLLAIGAICAGVGLGSILFVKDAPLGPGATLTVIGLAVLAAVVSLLDSENNRIGHHTAVAMSAVGASVFGWALIRSIWAPLLHDWRQPAPGYAMPTAVLGGLFLLVGLAGRFMLPNMMKIQPATDDAQQLKRWSNIAVLIGIMLGAIGLLRLVATGVLRQAGWYTKVPEPFLVPTGIVLMIAGLLFLLASVSSWSQNRLVAMTRREFTAFFVSPVAYLVMIAFAVIGLLNYRIFLNQVMRRSERGMPLEEPIIQGYILGIGAIFAVFAVIVAVPLLTMRLFSEEKRTGSLEVLLTAPVSDWQVVLSKFFAALGMFMVLWLPWALNLLSLRLEVGKPFDFRPLLAFGLALLASGASFVAMGLFFSSLTKNQIVSAALTFMGMMVLIAFYFFEDFDPGSLSVLGIGDKTFEIVKAAIRAMSFIDMWIEAIRGKIWLKDVCFHMSAALMWLFMSVKVLEARRWS